MDKVYDDCNTTVFLLFFVQLTFLRLEHVPLPSALDRKRDCCSVGSAEPLKNILTFIDVSKKNTANVSRDETIWMIYSAMPIEPRDA